MVSQEQEKQITDYLIFQKLPLDILLEVKDHMISQILDIQMNENLSFDEAFHKTQKLWENDFRMTSYFMFFSEKIPVIYKRIVKARYNHLIKKSLLLGLISAIVNIVLIYFSNTAEIYTTLFRIHNFLFVIIPIIIWLINRKKYFKINLKYRGRLLYSMYQQNLGMLFVCFSAMGQIILKKGKYAYLFFRANLDDNLILVLLL